VEGNLRVGDLAANIAVSLVELRGMLDAYDEAFRLFRSRLLEDPPPEYLMPVEWLPVNAN
jgi:hypothetical protein